VPDEDTLVRGGIYPGLVLGKDKIDAPDESYPCDIMLIPLSLGGML